MPALKFEPAAALALLTFMFAQDNSQLHPKYAMRCNAHTYNAITLVQAGVSIEEIDTSFPTAVQSGSHIVTVGDLYAEERKDILVKLQVGSIVASHLKMWSPPAG